MLRTQLRTAPSAQGGARIRPADGADAAAISAFISGLSARSQFLRFFASVSPPSSGLLKALSGAGGSADVLLACSDDGTVIGHAMAVDSLDAGGSLVSDIGLVVADSAQRQGVGAALLTALVARAARRGVTALVMDVLPANDRMLGMINRRWPDACREYSADYVRFRSALAGAGRAGAGRAGAGRAGAGRADQRQGGQHAAA